MACVFLVQAFGASMCFIGKHAVAAFVQISVTDVLGFVAASTLAVVYALASADVDVM